MANTDAIRDCPDLYENVENLNFETFQLGYGSMYPPQILVEAALYPCQCVDDFSLLNSDADDMIRLSVYPMTMLSVFDQISKLT